MTIQKVIKMALTYKGMSEAELARRLGITPQAFHNKMVRDSLKFDDLEKIAQILDAEFFFGIRFPDGQEIK